MLACWLAADARGCGSSVCGVNPCLTTIVALLLLRREGLWYDPSKWIFGRRLLDQTPAPQHGLDPILLQRKQKWEEARKQGPTRAAQKPTAPLPAGAVAAASRRLLQQMGSPWPHPPLEFNATASDVNTLCPGPDQLNGTDPNFMMVIDPKYGPDSLNTFGQMVYDSGVCEQSKTTWVSLSGAARHL